LRHSSPVSPSKAVGHKNPLKIDAGGTTNFFVQKRYQPNKSFTFNEMQVHAYGRHNQYKETSPTRLMQLMMMSKMLSMVLPLYVGQSAVTCS
jgi:hypothetical protein